MKEITKARKLLLKVDKLVTQAAIQEAQKILSRHKNLKEFKIGMGAAFFVDDKGQYIHTDEKQYMAKLDNMINEWYAIVPLTGMNIVISRNQTGGFYVNNL